jgi:hypothetical protein
MRFLLEQEIVTVPRRTKAECYQVKVSIVKSHTAVWTCNYGTSKKMNSGLTSELNCNFHLTLEGRIQ